MHLIEGPSNPVDGDFPELGRHRLFHFWIIKTGHLGFQIGTNLEASLDAAVSLLPDATPAVTGKARVPRVTVFIGSLESLAAVTAW